MVFLMRKFKVKFLAGVPVNKSFWECLGFMFNVTESLKTYVSENSEFYLS